MKKILGILVLFFTLSLSFSFADNSEIFSKVDHNYNKIVQIGNYTFNYKTDLFKVFDKTGKKQLITVYKGDFNYPTAFFVSDKYVYYTKYKDGKNALFMQIDLATKKTKAVKQYKHFASISAVKGSDIYYEIDSKKNKDEMYVPQLKVLNLKTGKEKSVAINATNVNLGKNSLFYMAQTYDVSATTLHSITYDYKNPKLISNTAFSYEIIGTKVYYAQATPEYSSNGDITKQILYVCSEDGSNKKALTGVINGYITKITADYVEFMSENQSKYYRMNLKTKKTIELKPSDR
ncbi:hypothetical protein HMPREF0379_0381 [[Eubacterium] yurii subsp. margaretiae ATCC 43715]|nr:hypothetical protein HMPREF0379_0381 [[Eubacterium] yurii subsp. margaretiae ATCC 43715]